jgi:two-component system OmpR family response regulator
MSISKTLLIVDDDQDIRDLLGRFLLKHGFNVLLAKDGQQMDEQLNKQGVDMIILDLMMPGEDGMSICRRLRQHSTIPILMLTAITEDVECILGLESGADDYLSKPFNPREVLARIKAIFRRAQTNQTGIGSAPIEKRCYVFSGWCLDDARRQLFSPDDVEVMLSSGEYDLLAILVKNPQQALSRDRLMTLTKNRSAEVYDRSIDIQISRLRHKLEEDVKNPKLIKTIRGNGYFLACAVSEKQLVGNS